MLITIWKKQGIGTVNITASKERCIEIINECIQSEVNFDVVTYRDQNPNKIEQNGYISHSGRRYQPTNNLEISQFLTTI